MSFHQFDPNDDESLDKMRDLFGPVHIDQLIRQAIQACWMLLPRGKRNVDETERHIRRMVDRAFKDMREDDKAFWVNLDNEK